MAAFRVSFSIWIIKIPFTAIRHKTRRRRKHFLCFLISLIDFKSPHTACQSYMCHILTKNMPACQFLISTCRLHHVVSIFLLWLWITVQTGPLKFSGWTVGLWSRCWRFRPRYGSSPLTRKISIVESLHHWGVACSASDRHGSNFKFCVWRAVPSDLFHQCQRVSSASAACVWTKVA